ncbi:hypothetical protein IAD21_03069 [Abditibacteriota bacterium]|nr:hypothetical protein IAD21_03069 [Abditibacteriota bacterium]
MELFWHLIMIMKSRIFLSFAIVLAIVGGESIHKSSSSPRHPSKQTSKPKTKRNFSLFKSQTQVTSIALSARGTLLACASEAPQSSLWSPKTIPDGRLGYEYSTARGLLSFWNTKTKKLVRKVPIRTTLRQMQFSPDGQTLLGWEYDYSVRPVAANAWGNTLALWSVKTGRLLRRFDMEGGPFAFSPNGRYCAMADFNSDELRVYDTRTWRRLKTLKWPDTEGGYEGLAFSPNSQQLAALSYSLEGGTDAMRVWDVRSGSQLLKIVNGLEDKDGIYMPFQFLGLKSTRSKRDQLIAVSSPHFVYARASRRRFKLSRYREIIGDPDFDPTVFHFGRVHLAMSCLHTVGHINPVHSLWNLDSRKKLYSWYAPHEYEPQDCFSRDGKIVAIMSYKYALVAYIVNFT